MNNELQNIYQELEETFLNLKAEVLVSEIEEKSSIVEEDIVVSNQSAFSRSYNRDLTGVKLLELQNKEVIQLDLARNSIYDLLPEGVFHNASNKSKTLSFSSYRKQQKREEADARLLLAPIENELFRKRVAIEKKGKKIVREFSNLQDDFLIDFWKIDKSIPRKYAIKLVRLLPYAHQISGNLELTFLSLKKILGVDVSFKKTFDTREVAVLGQVEQRLGVDFVLHQETLRVQQPLLSVTIFPDNKSEVIGFLKEKGILSFVSVFYKFFIPIEYKIETNVEVKQREGFILDEIGAFLGISTRV